MDVNRADAPPAYRLQGQELPGGWVVTERLVRGDYDTGGRFSVGYLIRRGGERAFLKAIDVRTSLMTDTGVALTRALLGGQLAEADVLNRCAEAGLDRVIAPLGSGVWADPLDPGATPVPYVITEWADGGDLRRLLTTEEIELQFAFGALHDLAVAVQQIHGQGITHHDLKPSNALIVGSKTKLGDFGHATDHEIGSTDYLEGTLAYAPPEILYGQGPSDAISCRAVDLYHLGSLIGSVFLFGLPITSLWVSLLDEELQPAKFAGALEDALPFIIDSFGLALDFVEAKLPAACDAPRVMGLVRDLCWPDPRRRGHRKEITGSHDPLALRRVISELNLLAKQARLSRA